MVSLDNLNERLTDVEDKLKKVMQQFSMDPPAACQTTPGYDTCLSLPLPDGLSAAQLSPDRGSERRAAKRLPDRGYRTSERLPPLKRQRTSSFLKF